MSKSQRELYQAGPECEADLTRPGSTETRLAPANPYSFSLSSLFLMVTAVGVYLGVLVNCPPLAAIVAAFAVPTIVIFFLRILKRRRAGEILSRPDQAFEMFGAFAIVYLAFVTAVIALLVIGFVFAVARD